MENQPLGMVSGHEKKDKRIIEDKRNDKAQKADIHQNYKRSIPPVSS